MLGFRRLTPAPQGKETAAMLSLTGKDLWMAVGFVGQVIFGLRFIVQWIATERQKRSVVPVAFWYFSLAGSIILLSYSIYRRDPVFMAGFALNLLIYLRNLYFIHRKPAGETAGQ
jgi:lipid-A-disaccharide synthase-like uncharacterized protein